MNQTNILLETGTNELEILEFFINEEHESGEPVPCHFGVNVAKVMQVIESPELEPSESAPHPCFLGTIPLRDLILPVLDLSIWLGMERKRSEYEVVIVTEFSNTVTGFLVSGVTEIHRVGWKEVEPPSGYIERLATNSIIGTVNREDHFIQLLDLESILADLDPAESVTAISDQVRASQQYRALVADDSATIRTMLKNNLVRANFDPTVVNTGEEALAYLRELKQKAVEENRPITDFVNIVISDIEMPKMDGFSLTKNIKEDETLGRLPVILYSSIITKELRHKGESVRADEQISKPDMGLMAEKALNLIEGRA